MISVVMDKSGLDKVGLSILVALIFAAATHAEDFQGYPLTNIRVIDGDTIEADIKLPWQITLRGQHIRCSDYDAWESSKRRRSVKVTDVEVERGKAAAAFLLELATRHTFFIMPDKEPRDNYGRILGTLHYYQNGGNKVSLSRIMTGHGHVRTEGQVE